MEIKQISLTATRDRFSRFQGISSEGVRIASFVTTLVNKIKSLFSLLTSIPLFRKRLFMGPLHFLRNRRNRTNADSAGGMSRTRRMRNKFNPKRFIKPLLITVVAVVLLIGAQRFVRNVNLSGSSSNSRDTEIKGAKATQDINSEFAFPLRDEEGENLSDVKYTIEKAELLDEIIVKGQKATSIKGRTFLIITLKIKNEYRSDIEMDTRDYIRLSVNGNRDEWLAPDIHNDPVEVQAISTKYTRVGFPINDSDTDLVLRVGEIDGEKEEIPLELN